MPTVEADQVIVLDNGGSSCKVGLSGEAAPRHIIPNFVAKAKGVKRPFVGDLVDKCSDTKASPTFVKIAQSQAFMITHAKDTCIAGLQRKRHNDGSA